MRPPSLVLDEGTRRLGCWESATRTLHLSAHLVENQPWQMVIEVLRHEMAHQYVDEVLQIRDETAHGPAFRSVCAARSIDARATASSDDAPDVTGIMRKVEGLLSLAESDNEHEAKSAMSAAHRLLRKHNIRLAEAPSADEYSFQQVGEVRGRTAAHEKILAGILGQHFFVQPIWVVAFSRSRGVRGRVLELCGRPENLEIASHVHAFMLQTCERLWRTHKATHGITSNRDRRRYLQGVMIGFNERLKGEAEVCEERGLVWVGDAGLDDWVGNRYPHLRSGRRTRMQMTDAWRAGRAAGQKVVWHRPIEKKRRGIRGLLGG